MLEFPRINSLMQSCFGIKYVISLLASCWRSTDGSLFPVGLKYVERLVGDSSCLQIRRY